METVLKESDKIEYEEEKSVCARCGSRPVFRCDLCEDCMTDIRNDAKAKIRKLKDIVGLRKISKADAPALASDVEFIYGQLCEYRERGYLYEAKTDIDKLHQEVIKRLNYSNRSLYKRWWFWLIMVFVVEIAVLGYFSATGAMDAGPAGYYNSDGTLKEDVSIDLSIVAHKVIRAYLKAPSTAEFDYSVEKYYLYPDGEDVFGITGTVTAENSFGVPLENDFLVKFWYGGDTATYTTYEVIIGDETYYSEAE